MADLSSQKRKPLRTKLDKPVSQDASGLTSGSSGTVVHTPHRHSLEAVNPAAQELFENGISFNTLRYSAEENTGSSEAYITLVRPKGNVEPPSTEGVRSESPLRHHEDQEGALSTRVDYDSGNPRRDPFLDISALGEATTQGQSSTSIPQPLFVSEVPSPMHSTPARSFRLLLSKGNRNKRPEPIPIVTSSSELGLLRTPMSSVTQAALTEPLASGEEAHPSHRSSPTRLLQYLKKRRRTKSVRLQSRREQTVTSRGLNSVTNMHLAQPALSPETRIAVPKANKPPSPQDAPPKEGVLARDKIKKDLDFLKAEVEKIDELHWMTEKKGLHPLPTDHEWIEGAIRDITAKSDQVMEIPVSTPTTTTTGYDPLASSLNPNRETAGGKTKSLPRHMMDRPSAKPTLSAAGTDSTGSRQKTVPSSLLSLTPDGQIVPIDITSMSTYGLASNQRESPGALERQRSGGMERKDPWNSTSPTSTFAVDEVKGISVKPWDLLRNRRPNRPPKRNYPRTQRQAAASKTIQLNHSPSGDPRRGPVYPRPEWRVWRMVLGAGDSFGRLMRHCPGAYPFHLDVEEDIAARSRGLPMVRNSKSNRMRNESKGTFDTVREFLFVARCHVEVFVRLYWTLAGPIFDPSSEYWVRNTKDEATFGDGVTFVLAMPGAFLGLLAFV